MVPRAIETSFVQWNLLQLQKNNRSALVLAEQMCDFPTRMLLGNDLQMVGFPHMFVYKRVSFSLPSGYWFVQQFSQGFSPSRSCQLPQQWGILNILVQWVNMCQKTFTDTWLDTCWYIWAKIYHDTTKKNICLHFRPLGPRTSLALFQFLAWAPTFGWLSGVGVGMELMW